MVQEVSTFTGSHNTYTRVGKIGDSTVGVSVQYVIHPQMGTGFLFVRFVLCGNEKQNLTTLKPREKGTFKNTDGSEFTATRLAKVAIPLFHPGPPPTLLLTMGDKYEIWNIVSDWIAERLKENGIELIVTNLAEVVKDLVSGKCEVEDSSYQLVLQFPDLGGN